MTNYEFKLEYDKLVEVYPQNFSSKFKEQAIANYIKDLDSAWWKALVNRIILSSNPRLDIEDAARGERLARKRYQETKGLLATYDALEDKITENGLKNVLEKMGVNSLEDAILKNKGEG